MTPGDPDLWSGLLTFLILMLIAVPLLIVEWRDRRSGRRRFE